MHRFATEFYQDAIGEWRWRVTADNNEIVGAATEGFQTRHDCVANFKTLLSYMHRDLLVAAEFGLTEKEPTPEGQGPFGLSSPSSVPSLPRPEPT